MSNGLVIGCASFDRLYIAGQTYNTIGGAGLYTALAAARSGTATTLLAPKPHPLPDLFTKAAQHINWIGPTTLSEDLPQLEIEHHGGGRATLINAAWGAEASLTPKYLPDNLASYQFIHIAALSSAARQLEFLRACRSRGATYISVGTYARVAYSETETVRTLFSEADVFFMNENEANGLLGTQWQSGSGISTRSGLYFVTIGEHGAVVFDGPARQSVDAVQAVELDPTGAGDTFCGSVLGLMAQGQGAVEAASQAVKLAGVVIQVPGPVALMS
jgi:sugar/nucleoside kinase (ribokinase family)